MRKRTAILIISVLLILSLIPWIVKGYAPRPLLPDELRQERTHYEATVAAAQDATIEAMRQATSVPNVVVIGTAAAPGLESSQGQPAPTATASAVETEGAERSATALPITLTSTLTIRTIVVVVESTASGSTITAVPADTTPAFPVETPTPSSTESVAAGGGPPTPSGMVETVDVITEQMLTDQIRQDADDASLTNLNIRLTAEGLSATSAVTVLPGVVQQVGAQGNFAVENSSLVFKAFSIRLDGRDVTDLYRGPLESQINTSLYRLLPERYVQSYELTVGQVQVNSLKRP